MSKQLLLVKSIHNALIEDPSSVKSIMYQIDEFKKEYAYPQLNNVIMNLDPRAMDVHVIHLVLFKLYDLRFVLGSYYTFYYSIVKELEYRNVCHAKSLIKEYYDKFGVPYL